CDWLFRLRHDAIAPLIDYGVFGEMRRFEAWLSDGPWRGSPDHATAVGDRASRFLRANTLTDGHADATQICAARGRAVLIPNAAAGYLDDHAEPAAAIDLEACGHRLIDRPSVTAMAEVFAEASRIQRTISICAPAGSGLSTILRDLARAARIGGFVPVSLSLDAERLHSLLHRRSLFLVSSRIDRGPMWSSVICW